MGRCPEVTGAYEVEENGGGDRQADSNDANAPHTTDITPSCDQPPSAHPAGGVKVRARREMTAAARSHEIQSGRPPPETHALGQRGSEYWGDGRARLLLTGASGLGRAVAWARLSRGGGY